MRRLLALLAVLLLATPLAAAADKPWVQVRSPHFIVVTDAGENRGRETALRFEQMRAVFGSLLNRQNLVNIPVPLEIIGFRNHKELKQVVPIWKGKPIDVDGLYQQGDDRNFIAVDLSSERAWETIFHEYAHMLLNANFERTAVWFDEGFAEYYSTIRITNKEVVIGAPPQEAADTIHANSWIPVEQLFSVRHDSKIYNETSDARGMFYIESWVFVHYLFDMKQLPALQTYFNLVNQQHVPVAEAIQSAFGMPAKRFNEAVEKRLHGVGVTQWKLGAPIQLNSRDYAVSSLDPLDEKAVIADMHLHSPEYGDKALAEFREILQADPKHAAALRGLGYAYLRKNDFEHAAPYFKEAAALDSQDPRVHYYYALMLYQQGGSGEAYLNTLENELNTSIRLDPTFADAYYLLGYAQMRRQDTAAAVASMETAHRLNAREDRYALGLAEAYLAARDYDKAGGLLAALSNGSNVLIATQAQRVAEALAQARRFEEEAKTNAATAPPPASRGAGAPDNGPEAGTPQESGEVKTIVDPRPIKFAYATLQSVDCSQPPAAVLHLVIGGKAMQMYTADRSKLLLIGADAFSCDWVKRKVLVNYRPGGEHENDLVSIELE